MRRNHVHFFQDYEINNKNFQHTHFSVINTPASIPSYSSYYGGVLFVLYLLFTSLYIITNYKIHLHNSYFNICNALKRIWRNKIFTENTVCRNQLVAIYDDLFLGSPIFWNENN